MEEYVTTAFRLLAQKLKEKGAQTDFARTASTSKALRYPRMRLCRAPVVVGSLLWIIGDAATGESGAGQSLALAFNILQAAGCRSLRRIMWLAQAADGHCLICRKSLPGSRHDRIRRA